jgi:hypothetical protein
LLSVRLHLVTADKVISVLGQHAFPSGNLCNLRDTHR